MTSNIPSDSPSHYNSTSLIKANKKELLEQSSYLTRLNSLGCREKSRKNTAFILSVTFNSDVFPKIKKDGVFRIIPNKEYKDVLKGLKGVFATNPNDFEEVANIFRFFDAATRKLICVGYAKYENDTGQTAMEAKPTKMIVRKMKGATELNVDIVFEHFIADWAASFGLNSLIVREGDPLQENNIVIPQNEDELWAAKKGCSKDSNSLPWSTYEQGFVMDEPVQKTYSFDKSDIDEDKIIAAYIGPQVFGDDFLKKLNITGKSFRASPFKNSKLFKIYYSPYLDEIDFSNNQINDVENKLMGEARGIGRARKLNREGTKYRTKLEKKGYRKNFVNDNNKFPPIAGGAPGEGLKLPIQYNDHDIKSMIENVTNGNFGQIEKLADLLAKNGYERYTITKIGNDNIGTIVNAFLNNQDNEDRIKEFQDKVKECHFRLDCKTKKQVRGKESSQDNQANRNTKRVQIETLYQELQDIFNEFVKTQYFNNFESKDIVIKDNYETLKKTYINFFINLQQRIRRTRKGRGKLSINNKKDIEKEYTKNNDSDEEDSDKESRLSRVGNFFMNLWSGFSERFKKKGDNPDEYEDEDEYEDDFNNVTSEAGSEYNVPSETDSEYESGYEHEDEDDSNNVTSEAGSEYNVPSQADSKYVPKFPKSLYPNDSDNERSRGFAKLLGEMENSPDTRRLRQTYKEPAAAQRKAEKEAQPRDTAQRKADKEAREIRKQRERNVRKARKARDQGVFPNPAFGLTTVYNKTGNPNNTNVDTEPEYAKPRNNNNNNNMPFYFTQPNDTGRSGYAQSTPSPVSDAEGFNSNNPVPVEDRESAIKFMVKTLGLSEEKAKKLYSKGKKTASKINAIQRRKPGLNNPEQKKKGRFNPFRGLFKKGGTKKIKKTKKNATKKKYANKVGGLKKRKGKKGKTHRVAKKTGRRYYLKTLKKRT